MKLDMRCKTQIDASRGAAAVERQSDSSCLSAANAPEMSKIPTSSKGIPLSGFQYCVCSSSDSSLSKGRQAAIKIIAGIGINPPLPAPEVAPKRSFLSKDALRVSRGTVSSPGGIAPSHLGVPDKMPWGRHKGEAMCDVPTRHLEWCLRHIPCCPDFVEEVLRKRGMDVSQISRPLPKKTRLDAPSASPNGTPADTSPVPRGKAPEKRAVDSVVCPRSRMLEQRHGIFAPEQGFDCAITTGCLPLSGHQIVVDSGIPLAPETLAKVGKFSLGRTNYNYRRPGAKTLAKRAAASRVASGHAPEK